MPPLLSFVHITDSHITSDGAPLHGVDSVPNLRRAVRLINDFPTPPDFVLHTGDVSHDRGEPSYEQAQAILAELRVPIYYARGNHDDPALLRKYLDAPLSADGALTAPLDYTFEVKGERFLVLDGCWEHVRDPLGWLSDEQLARVRAEATPQGPPLTVVLHYPPFEMGSLWLDANMILTNGAALHEALLPARERLRAVFCGHLHRSSQIVRDGITYISAPSVAPAYAWQPWDDDPRPDLTMPPAYSTVHYFADRVVVQQYTFARA